MRAERIAVRFSDLESTSEELLSVVDRKVLDCLFTLRFLRVKRGDRLFLLDDNLLLQAFKLK